MNRAGFLRVLRDGLAGLPADDVDEVLADYAAHFDEAAAASRSEHDVAEALGDPGRLARELRAELEFRRWENHHSLRNSAHVLLALGGLAAVDVLLLIPLLFGGFLVLLIGGLVMFVLGIVGLGLLISVVKMAPFVSLARVMLRAAMGAGLVCASLGLGALLAFGLNVVVRRLGEYARLHYRLLKSEMASEPA